MIMSLKQSKIKFELRIKLNHNIILYMFMQSKNHLHSHSLTIIMFRFCKEKTLTGTDKNIIHMYVLNKCKKKKKTSLIPHSHQSLNMFICCLVKHGLKLFSSWKLLTDVYQLQI